MRLSEARKITRRGLSRVRRVTQQGSETTTAVDGLSGGCKEGRWKAFQRESQMTSSCERSTFTLRPLHTAEEGQRVCASCFLGRMRPVWNATACKLPLCY